MGPIAIVMFAELLLFHTAIHSVVSVRLVVRAVLRLGRTITWPLLLFERLVILWRPTSVVSSLAFEVASILSAIVFA